MHVVVNWLWQGGALTAVAAVSMRTAPRLSATTRYLVWWTTLILVVLLPALPWLVAVAGAPAPPANAVGAIAPVPLPELPAWPRSRRWCGRAGSRRRFRRRAKRGSRTGRRCAAPDAGRGSSALTASPLPRCWALAML